MNTEIKKIDKNKPTATPSVYVTENAEGYEIAFTVPGIGKEDVDLNVENRTLTMRAESKFDAPEGYECASREFPVYNYAVSLDLPEHADTGTIKATVADGVLTVKLSKRAELKPRKIEVAAE